MPSTASDRAVCLRYSLTRRSGIDVTTIRPISDRIWRHHGRSGRRNPSRESALRSPSPYFASGRVGDALREKP